MQTHEYRTARAIGKFIAAIGWIAIVLAGLGIFFLLGGRGIAWDSFVGVLGLPLALGLAVGGLLLVGQGQLLQAAADTARSSGRAAELLEQIQTSLSASSRVTSLSAESRGLTADQSISRRRS